MGGAAWHTPDGTWLLVDAESGARSLGGALAWFLRNGVGTMNLVLRDEPSAAIASRRAVLFTNPVRVWRSTSAGPVEVQPGATPTVGQAVDPESELFEPLLREAGLDVVVEDGIMRGEHLGLEVARVAPLEDPADGSPRVELRVGVGRFDQEASALVNEHRSPLDTMKAARDLVARHRRGGVGVHPANQLVPERWLRSVVIADPSLIGASDLVSVEPVPPRANLREQSVAPMLGHDLDGRQIVAVASCGVDLDLVPAAADARAAHAPDARLVLVTPERDRHPITVELAGALRSPAEVVAVPDDWKGGAVG